MKTRFSYRKSLYNFYLQRGAGAEVLPCVKLMYHATKISGAQFIYIFTIKFLIFTMKIFQTFQSERC
jgi:hypothetical protein